MQCIIVAIIKSDSMVHAGVSPNLSKKLRKRSFALTDRGEQERETVQHPGSTGIFLSNHTLPLAQMHRRKHCRRYRIYNNNNTLNV